MAYVSEQDVSALLIDFYFHACLDWLTCDNIHMHVMLPIIAK